jgi:molybdopterin-guanine dinucleotide biosynthesis protein B
MTGLDIIIVEGYKDENKPKIEIFRSAVHEKPRFLNDPNLIALASDVEMEVEVPVFSLDDASKLASFIIEYFNLEV